MFVIVVEFVRDEGTTYSVHTYWTWLVVWKHKGIPEWKLQLLKTVVTWSLKHEKESTLLSEGVSKYKYAVFSHKHLTGHVMIMFWYKCTKITCLHKIICVTSDCSPKNLCTLYLNTILTLQSKESWLQYLMF